MTTPQTGGPDSSEPVLEGGPAEPTETILHRRTVQATPVGEVAEPRIQCRRPDDRTNGPVPQSGWRALVRSAQGDLVPAAQGIEGPDRTGHERELQKTGPIRSVFDHLIILDLPRGNNPAGTAARHFLCPFHGSHSGETRPFPNAGPPGQNQDPRQFPLTGLGSDAPPPFPGRVEPAMGFGPGPVMGRPGPLTLLLVQGRVGFPAQRLTRRFRTREARSTSCLRWLAFICRNL
jgi:hypothetical protein